MDGSGCVKQCLTCGAPIPAIIMADGRRHSTRKRCVQCAVEHKAAYSKAWHAANDCPPKNPNFYDAAAGYMQSLTFGYVSVMQIYVRGLGYVKVGGRAL